MHATRRYLMTAGSFDPHEARLIELSERGFAAAAADVRLSEEYWRLSKRFARVGFVASLLVAVAVVFMAVKP